MSDFPKCSQCGSEYTYQDGALYICPECGSEWAVHSEPSEDAVENVVKDAYGNILQGGDSVTVIKSVKVKGAASDLKAGVKVKNIRLVKEVNGHNIEAKIPGYGTMMLKSEIVKKSS